MDWIHQNVNDVLRVLVMAVITYVSVVAMFRISGKRTLSKLNAFDFIVTVAFGSTLATILLSKDVSYTEGLMAFVALVSLQYVISFLASKFGWFRKLIKSEPIVLFLRGEFLDDNIDKARMSRQELYAAMRESGIASTDKVAAMVLETNGHISVLQGSKDSKLDTLEQPDNLSVPEENQSTSSNRK